MKQLREYIKKELKVLKEGKMVKKPLPEDVKNILLNTLRLKKSQISNIQAIKSIKPTYKIYLNNNQSFTLSDLGNNFGFGLVNIKGKNYDILDRNQYNLVLKTLNKLQTDPIMSITGDEAETDTGSNTSGGGGGASLGDEPTDEPEDEPTEEPEA